MNSPPGVASAEPSGFGVAANARAAGAGAGLDLEGLIAAERPRVTRLAFRLLGWRGDVEDVVQDVFLAALQGAKTFRAGAQPSTWLAAITIRTCRTRWRRWRVWARWHNAARAQAKPAAVGAAPSGMDDVNAKVREAVRELPAKYREVVVLRYLEGLGAAEVGSILRITPGAVEVRLSRAREQLRRRLANLQEGLP
jgi:RNA polymerase sigma-70 factor (ECF subfamily)